MIVEDQDLDELLRALAHAQRRMFLMACLDQPQSAGDLAHMSNLAIASVSEHLKVLRKTRLLRLEKQGRFRFYQTDRSVLAAVISALIEMSDGT